MSSPRRFLVLGVCCLSLLIVNMDNTIMNVALPSIRVDLHASVSGLQWSVDAYLLVLASLVVLAGSTADRIGRRRIFTSGLVLFMLGSLLCSLAPTLSWLIVFRMIQATGGCMLNPVAMSIITNVFIERRERARAIGLWGAVTGISMGLGPVIGGVLVETVGWRAIFWINLPIGVAALILTLLFVPESKAAIARRIDPIGQLILIVVLAALTYCIIDAPAAGWGSAQTRLLFALAAAGVLAFIVYELHRTEPLIDLRFFRSLPFSGAALTAVCVFSSFSAFLFVLTLYLQDVRHLSPLRAGLFLVPMAAAASLLAALTGRWVARYGTRLPLCCAGALMACGAIQLTRLSADTSYLWILWCCLTFAIGWGMVNTPITHTAMSGMPLSQAGVAAAITSTSRQVGAVMGVAVAGSLINKGNGTTGLDDLASASHAVWWVLTALGAVVLVVALISTGQLARRTSADTAAMLDADAQATPDPQPDHYQLS